jgi:hypothetical protein
VDRGFPFSDAAKIAQVSWERWQRLEPLLEDFPTYPGPGQESTSKGHVIALARVMEGMDAALRSAEAAEASVSESWGKQRGSLAQVLALVI